MEYSSTAHVSHVLLLTILFTSTATSASTAAMRADLTHVDSGRGFTKLELLRRMAMRTRLRAARLSSANRGGAHPATIYAFPGGGSASEYLIHVSIGMPRPQRVSLNLDTGSDLVWTQCQGCQVCFDQPHPKFDASNSSTLTDVPCWDGICGDLNGACIRKTQGCGYIYSYGDGTITVGKMVRDTFTFRASDGKGGAVSVPKLSFGCGLYNKGLFISNDSGIAGFGRGPLSLPSQLKIGSFSYCFTSAFESNSKTSPVFLGTQDNLYAHATGPVQSTRLIQNPKDPSSYYLPLKGITVGTKRLPIPESVFALKDGAGGTMIDSGTSFTEFPTAVYELIRNAFVAQTRPPVSNSTIDGIDDRCFSTAAGPAEAKKVRVPHLVLHFEGADLHLPRENYLLEDDTTGQVCLLFRGVPDEMTIIGNLQQQNIHLVHDLKNNKLFFVPAECDKL